MGKQLLSILSLIMPIILLTSCGSKNNDYPDDNFSWQSKYEKADFEKYKEPTSVNDLDGTLISIKGTVTKILDSLITENGEELESFILTDDEKHEWVISCTENSAKLPSAEDEIVAYGEYMGAAGIYENRPSIYLLRYINTDKYTEVINIISDGMYILTEFEGYPKGIKKIELISDNTASVYYVYLSSSKWDESSLTEQGKLAKDCIEYCELLSKNDSLISYSLFGVLPNGQNAFYYDGRGNKVKLYIDGVYKDDYSL